MKRARPTRGGGRSLWLWVALAFAVLAAAWGGLIVLALQRQPEVIEIKGR